MFSVLAGVRRGEGDAEPIAWPRDVPDDITPEVLAEYTNRVVPADEYDMRSPGVVSQEHADRCAQQYQCRWFPGNRIQDPDWHSASWLTLRELLAYPWPESASAFPTRTLPSLLALLVPEGQVLPFAASSLVGDPTAVAVLSDWLEEHHWPGLDDVRMVFWFDN